MLKLFLASLLYLLIPAKAESDGTPAKPLDSLTITSKQCRLGGACASTKPETHFHTGVDYKAAAGAPVYAICDGKVREDTSQRKDVWNRFIVIEHTNCGDNPKLYSYYGHIDSVIGGIGSKVERGQKIATVKHWPGNTHLHFGISPIFFSGGWGYQKGDPIQNGWLDPIAFLSQAFNSGQSKQPLTTKSASALQGQDSQPKSTGNKGSFKWRANIDRKELYPQEICDAWIRRAYARDRIMLNVRHIIKRDPVNARVIHSCQMHYRLKPPSSLIQGLSLNDYTRPRTQEETSLYNAMSQACSQRYGLGYGINLGRYGTHEETKVYCAKRTGWVKVYE